MSRENSGLTIKINEIAFLDIFYKTLNLPDMMLVGGGGGNHPFFPSLEREKSILLIKFFKSGI